MPNGPVHSKPHPHKKKRIEIDGHFGTFTVLDWFDREADGRWHDLRGENRVATGYANRRNVKRNLPKDDEVVVVYDGSGRTFAIHNSEIRKVKD